MARGMGSSAAPVRDTQAATTSRPTRARTVAAPAPAVAAPEPDPAAGPRELAPDAETVRLRTASQAFATSRSASGAVLRQQPASARSAG